MTHCYGGPPSRGAMAVGWTVMIFAIALFVSVVIIFTANG